METRDRLAADFPIFALEVRTPSVTLRCATDDDLVTLAELGAAGVHGPDDRPFTVPWTSIAPPFQQRNSLEFFWAQRATSQAEAWSIPLAVIVGGEIVGTQGLMASSWKATRTFETGSWLGLAHHGKGIGKEMRMAALHLGFAGFGAEAAITAAYADNPASLGVTRALGYRDNGHDRHDRAGELVILHRFEMLRAEWELRRRDDIEVVGADAVAELFGTVRPPVWPTGQTD